jgi:hypothetical protein
LTQFGHILQQQLFPVLEDELVALLQLPQRVP